MNKLNFVQKLPIGFRFEPTDEEIVFQYLVRKVFSYPLPSLIIPELILPNIFSTLHPSQLPGDSEQDSYFFSNNCGNIYNNNGTSGGTFNYYWKSFGVPSDLDKQIITSSKSSVQQGLPIVGVKKTLVFYNGADDKTDWFMNVYCIAFSGNYSAPPYNQKIKSQGSLIKMGNWVLCHVFLKKRWNIYDSVETDIISDTEYSSSSDSDSSYLTDDDDDVSSSSSFN